MVFDVYSPMQNFQAKNLDFYGYLDNRGQAKLAKQRNKKVAKNVERQFIGETLNHSSTKPHYIILIPKPPSSTYSIINVYILKVAEPRKQLTCILTIMLSTNPQN